MSSPTACSTGAAARRRWCSAPPPCAPMVERLLPGANILTPPAPVAAHLRGREEAHAPAAPHRHRRVLGRRGLRDRRADPPPARRRRRGARLALAAHPQRAGRALPVGRRRLSRRHRRDRHGAQPRRRSRRLRRPTASSTAISSASSIRPSSARSPAAPAAPCATAPSAPPAAARRSRPSWCRRSRATLRAGQGAAMAQHRARLLLARRARRPRSPRRRREQGLTRAPVAEDILVLEHAVARRGRARDRDGARRGRAACGTSARFPTIARSRPPPMPSSRSPSMVF